MTLGHPVSGNLPKTEREFGNFAQICSANFSATKSVNSLIDEDLRENDVSVLHP